MSKKLLHTPEGVRDIYSSECEKKLVLQNLLHTTIRKYGFHSIQTPTFEFFDIFASDIGTTPSKDLYKFFDKEGNTLVLRPDMTPSVARCAAKYYMDEDMPIRLTYMGNTFINQANYRGRLKETTQIGVELIGDDSIDADGEIVALIVECLLKSGLQDFQVSIGEVDFFKSILSESLIDEETEETLRDMISNKNFFGVEEILSEQNINEESKNVLLKLPELFGSVDVLSQAAKLTSNKEALEAIERLGQLYDVIKAYGFEKYISFDLGMISDYKYYTGIIIKAFTYGTGEAVVKGGRYDNLIARFGKDAASIGFTIVIDQLMAAMQRQKIDINVEDGNALILYNKSERDSAIRLTMHYRDNGESVEMMAMKDNEELNSYIEFAKRNDLRRILYLEDSENVNSVNVSTSEVKEIKLVDLLEKMEKMEKMI